MILRAFKYRLYPNQDQVAAFGKHFGCCRFVYNWGLQKRIKEYQENKKSISLSELQASLTLLKREHEWLNEINSQSLQSSLRNLDAAYTKFFREKKGFPRFKSRSNRQSFKCPQKCKVDFDAEMISLPKIKNIRAVFDREFNGKIKTITISETPTGKYYASILVETPGDLPTPPKPNINSAVGLDLGLSHYVTLSTGEKIENPKHLQKLTDRLSLLHRRLSRKSDKSSNRRKKARLRLSKLHEKIVNQREDYLHKLSTRLVKENETICLEDLSIAGMLKNNKLARSISSASWFTFVEMLKYKAEWNGVNILQIGRFDPSSKMCSCGYINRELKLKDRVWTCLECQVTHDRDILAANNIKNFAFNPHSLIENLGNNRAGSARINVQGEDKLQEKSGGLR